MPSVSKNIFWLSISRVIGIIAVFFAYAYLFRYLGVTDTGKYQFILSFATLFGVIVDLGLSQYLVKKMSEDLHKVKKYFHNFFVVEAGLAVTVYAAMVIIALTRNLDGEVLRGIMVAGIGIALGGLTMPFLSVLSAFQDLKKVAWINFCSSMVNVAIITLTITSGHGIVFLASNLLVSQALALVLYYQFLRNHIARPELLSSFTNFDPLLIKQIVKATIPFTLLVGFSTVYNRIDVVIITRLLGYHDTGLYTTAYKVVDLMNFFPAVISHSLYPAFAGLMAQGAVAQVRETLEKYLRFLIMVAIPIGVGGSLLASRIVLVMTAGDERFIPSAGPLAVLIWAVVLLTIYIVVNALVISQLTRLAVWVTGVNVLVNIIGNIILLPRIGIMGAAIMTVVSEGLQAIFYFYFVRKNITKFAFARFFVKPLVAAGVMGVVLYYIRSWTLVPGTSFAALLVNLGAVVAAGGVVYALVLGLVGFFKREDLVFIKQFVRK